MIRLVQREFRIWLRQRQRFVVGDPNSPTNCPLCQFLKQKGAKTVRMGFSTRTVNGVPQGNSPWQRNFQKRAIRLQTALNVTGLRGGEALEALDDVT